VHIGFDVAVTELHGIFERGHRVLGRLAGSTTMGEGDGSVVIEVAIRPTLGAHREQTSVAPVPPDAMVMRFRHCVAQGDARLAEAVTLLALQQYPEVSVEQTEAALARLAAGVPEPSRESLLGTLFGPGGFIGHTGDYYDPDNSFLHRVLERRLGIPISLAFVAMDIGRRIGVPLDGVGYPGHFLLRDRGDPSVYIDPFGGRVLTEGECVVWFHRSHPAGAIWQRSFLHPVDNVALLTRMLANLVPIYQRNRDFAGIRWMMQLRCALPNATRADDDAFARLMAPLN
jgi:regulator of sirC expression with transglutaminase-like and TPR domain